MPATFPLWFTVIASVSLAIACATATLIAVDVARRPQPMAVMNLVFPVVALFGSVPWAVFYWRRRRRPARGSSNGARPGGGSKDKGNGNGNGNGNGRGSEPQWVSIATGTSHCGAGCAIGDVIAEFGVAVLPALAVAVGKGSLFERDMYAAWIWDFVFAFAIGIALQYFALAPMRNESRRSTLRDAVKADTASIIAWQVGMYGLMALIQLVVFTHAFGGTAPVFSAEFWFAMQIAMIAGFACSFPVNAVLIRRGVKEAM